jgi:type I restriction enzyme M protein
MNADQLKQLENDLWNAADTLRANSGLKSNEYATPILGLIFLKFADNKYRAYEAEIMAEYAKHRDTRAEREIAEIAIEKCGFYLPDTARYHYLLDLPESENIAKAVRDAMEEIEHHVPFLNGTLPKDEYFTIGKDSRVMKRVLQNFSNIPPDAEGDLFGQIYEYFLGKFAIAEGAGGGEFFTPRSVVRLMVEIIEPHRGKVFDPACGSGGMFVQSARFIEERRKHGATDNVDDLYVYGQEKTLGTVKLAKMNLAVNGIRGEIKEGNSYSEDLFDSYGKFDFVLANPPFNVDNVDVETVSKNRRFTEYGLPRNKTKGGNKSKGGGTETIPNGNYLWISLFATSLKEGGRAALVMANSASDAQHTEADIRRRLIEADLIYGMLALPSNMFYTVTLPATLWFFEKGKADDRILFIDARNVYTQIDRAHREFTEDQVQNLAVISYLHRGERHRFLERIEDCITQGSRRLTECRAEFPCVQQLLIEALPTQLANDLVDTDDAVAQAIQGMRDAIRQIEHRWHDADGVLQRLLDDVAQSALSPIVEGMEEMHIAKKTANSSASPVPSLSLSISPNRTRSGWSAPFATTKRRLQNGPRPTASASRRIANCAQPSARWNITRPISS